MDHKILNIIKNNTSDKDLTKEDKERLNKINNYRKILDKLLQKPLIKQRSKEWHELRKNRLTASDLGEAISKNNKSIVKKKAGLYHDNNNIIYKNLKPLVWGTMFESMAQRTYSQKNNNIIVHEFGLIPDKNLKHFGASPDGITELGVMIEIKCPISRKIIDGDIPEKYYIQIQGQLAVCELDECDYIECNFKVFESKEEYLKDEQENEKTDHGIIAEFKDHEDNLEYEYSDEYLTKDEAINNIELKVANKNNPKLRFIKYNYWKLIQINVQKVYFNKQEWETNIVPKINDFWEKVESHRKQGPFIEDSD